LLDRINFTATADGVSQGRIPDGGSTITNFVLGSTPGKANELIVYTGPVLNEVMAINDGSIRSGFNRASDWVELFNSGSTSYDMSGMGLGDNSDGTIRWTFPFGTIIPAGGYIVVWCDSDVPSSTESTQILNCGFSLKGRGGGVYLYDVQRRLVDKIEYGQQVSGFTIGRVNDVGGWQLLSGPTLGSKNGGSATMGNQLSLKINEWLANSVNENDWIELYNPSALPVSLTGMILKDNPGMLTSGYIIGQLSYVGANSYAYYIADNQGGTVGHLNFALDKMGETIQLLTSNLIVVPPCGWALSSKLSVNSCDLAASFAR